MKRAKQFTLWAITCSIFTYLMWRGIHGNIIAWRIFAFFAWFNVIVQIIMVFKVHNDLKDHPENAPQYDHYAWPKLLSIAYDFGMAATLAGYGHTIYAIIQIVSMFLEADTRAEVEKYRGSNSQTTPSPQTNN